MPEDSKDYKVGRCKPPIEHQFKKGKSGNPLGRPKSKKPDSVDISALLSEPVRVKSGDKVVAMSPFEVGLRQMAKGALEGNLQAIIKFLRLCDEYGAIAAPPSAAGGGVIQAPKGVNLHEWLESVTEVVPIDEA